MSSDIAESRRQNGQGRTVSSEESEAELRTRIERLEEENRRLRDEYARRRRNEYRRAALALGAIGVLAVAAGAALPAVRNVLIVVGAIGIFGAVLTRYLTPERLVSADVGERVFSALSGNEAALAAELGLQDDRVYVPVDGPEPARLFVPERRDYDLPTGDDLTSTLVVPADEDARGLALTPTGASLYREVVRSATEPALDNPTTLVETLGEAFVETFELVDAVETDVRPSDGRATVEVFGDAFGDGTNFDEPVPSTLAVGLAAGLETAVTAETTPIDDHYAVTCRWDPETTGSDGSSDVEPLPGHG
ncbi:hypothetical protein [Halobaculum sp. EA56]|uniref:hypothetical protein n=1 Tax=Halobaculum sp. EA56 TaxID=3421648 RepID=UPI003EB90378